MTSSPRSRPSRVRVRTVVLAAGTVLVLAFLAWAWSIIVRMSPRQPPVPKAYPACREVPTRQHAWRGISFRYPAGWTVKEDKAASAAENYHSLSILPPGRDDDPARYFQSIVIFAVDRDPKARAVLSDAWSLPEGETPVLGKHELLGLDTVPGSVRKLMVSQRRGLLSLHRGMGLLPKERDMWRLLVEHKETSAFQVTSGSMFNPYRRGPDFLYSLSKEQAAVNDEIACGFWTVAQSLKLPK
ncbi:MAG: hypothetical protein HY748_13285 [Elusimicrobia bacterium]|nr:hypothetical protein [Elusimicrobiota bacterium]